MNVRGVAVKKERKRSWLLAGAGATLLIIGVAAWLRYRSHHVSLWGYSKSPHAEVNANRLEDPEPEQGNARGSQHDCRPNTVLPQPLPLDTPPQTIESMLGELERLCSRQDSRPRVKLIELLVALEDVLLDDSKVDAALPLLAAIVTSTSENERKRFLCTLLLGCAQRRPSAKDTLLRMFHDSDDRMAIFALYALQIMPPVGQLDPSGRNDLADIELRKSFWYAPWRSYHIGPLLDPQRNQREEAENSGTVECENEDALLPGVSLACAVGACRVPDNRFDKPFRLEVVERTRKCTDTFVLCEMIRMISLGEDIMQLAMDIYWRENGNADVKDSMLDRANYLWAPERACRFFAEVARTEQSPDVRAHSIMLLGLISANRKLNADAVADILVGEYKYAQDPPVVAKALVKALGHTPSLHATDFLLGLAASTSDTQLRRDCYTSMGYQSFSGREVYTYRANKLFDILRDCPPDDISTASRTLMGLLNMCNTREGVAPAHARLIENAIPVLQKRAWEIPGPERQAVMDEITGIVRLSEKIKAKEGTSR
jgi:hypothetical protein